MTAEFICWRADSMAVCVRDAHGRRQWCNVDWRRPPGRTETRATFVHLSTRYALAENGTTLEVIELLPRPGDGSDQPSLPECENPGRPPKCERPKAKGRRPDQPSLF